MSRRCDFTASSKVYSLYTGIETSGIGEDVKMGGLDIRRARTAWDSGLTAFLTRPSTF